MSKKEEKLKERNLKDLIKKACISNRRNCSKYWKGVTREHYIVMCELVHKLASSNWECFTEVEFVNGGRADIVAVCGGIGQIIEVLHTEKKKKFEKKKLKYPKEFILRHVKTEDFDINMFDI